jgi:hypothetical protein
VAEEQVVEQQPTTLEVTQTQETKPTETSPEATAESDAAFEAGFAETRGQPAAKSAPKAEEPAKDAKAEPVKEAATEPAKAVAAPAKTPLEAAVDALDHRFKSFEGRLGKITTTLETLAAGKAAATTVSAAGGDAPTQAQVQDAAKSSDRWKRLTEDFPDWAEAIDERFAAIPQAKEVDLSGIKTDFSKQLADAKTEARQLARIDAKHEGWEETVNTDEFKAWLTKQAPEKQALAKSDKAKDAITLLDDFKAAGKKDKEANDKRLKSAIPAKGVVTTPQPSINDDDAFESGFKAVRG